MHMHTWRAQPGLGSLPSPTSTTTHRRPMEADKHDQIRSSEHSICMYYSAASAAVMTLPAGFHTFTTSTSFGFGASASSSFEASASASTTFVAAFRAARL